MDENLRFPNAHLGSVQIQCTCTTKETYNCLRVRHSPTFLRENVGSHPNRSTRPSILKVNNKIEYWYGISNIVRTIKFKNYYWNCTNPRPSFSCRVSWTWQKQYSISVGLIDHYQPWRSKPFYKEMQLLVDPKLRELTGRAQAISFLQQMQTFWYFYSTGNRRHAEREWKTVFSYLARRLVLLCSLAMAAKAWTSGCDRNTTERPFVSQNKIQWNTDCTSSYILFIEKSQKVRDPNFGKWVKKKWSRGYVDLLFLAKTIDMHS